MMIFTSFIISISGAVRLGNLTISDIFVTVCAAKLTADCMYQSDLADRNTAWGWFMLCSLLSWFMIASILLGWR